MHHVKQQSTIRTLMAGDLDTPSPTLALWTFVGAVQPRMTDFVKDVSNYISRMLPLLRRRRLPHLIVGAALVGRL